MNLNFITACGRSKTVLADDEVVGHLMKGVGKQWAFIERLDFLGISPRIAAEIRAGVADHVALLNITARLTS